MITVTEHLRNAYNEMGAEDFTSYPRETFVRRWKDEKWKHATIAVTPQASGFIEIRIGDHYLSQEGYTFLLDELITSGDYAKPEAAL